jgi:hypothetical protein
MIVPKSFSLKLSNLDLNCSLITELIPKDASLLYTYREKFLLSYERAT